MAKQSTQLSLDSLKGKALADYERHLGDTVLASRVQIISNGNTTVRWLSHPARLRVIATPAEQILSFSSKDRVTPEWCVAAVHHHPEVPQNAQLRVFARTYHADGRSFAGDIRSAGSEHAERFALASVQTVMRAAMRFTRVLSGVGGALSRSQ